MIDWSHASPSALDADTCRAAREAIGWTPLRLALAAGLAERTVCDFEAGRRAPRPGTRIALSRAFRAAQAANDDSQAAP
jgi:transcriptional regulator with XRE-family HTH domain